MLSCGAFPLRPSRFPPIPRLPGLSAASFPPCTKETTRAAFFLYRRGRQCLRYVSIPLYRLSFFTSFFIGVQIVAGMEFARSPRGVVRTVAVRIGISQGIG